MPGRLQDKVAIVTGAAGGIGRAIALAYHAEGAKVICADLREASRFESDAAESSGATHDLINAQGGRAVFVRTDTGEPAQVEALVKRAVEEFGRVDVMVNNAGVAPETQDPRPVWEVPVEWWEATHRVNSTGIFLGVKYAAAQMVKQDPHPSGDRGWIINTSSILGLVGTANAPSYCASKGAVVNLTRAAALDCAPQRIHVNCICPGYTASALTQNLLGDPVVKGMLTEMHGFGQRLGEPEDVARACVFLASEDARWVSGIALPVDGGYTAR